MGCMASQEQRGPTAAPAGGQVAPFADAASGGRRLLEEYSVGATLGEGAFGVVSNCTKRSTGEQFAVKMVDKVETPVEAIKKEAEMLQMMDHPNIVKFHGVFYERCFVCIVMDKYSGGDLVEGLQRHLKDKGQINCHDVVHVARQMGSGIQYLHRRLVVHRDVKGDNYLMDRKDITDQKNRIVLTDFGTAVQTQPNERLSAGVGTKIFWSPEFYDKDYSLKVDVWAMGVIMYGLVSGRFPFKDHQDIKTKEVKIPKRVHPVCEDFIKRQLEKAEKSRMSADEVMEHQWIRENGMKGSTSTGESFKDDANDQANKADLREDNVNDGIKERRQELIQRLNMEHDARGRGDVRRKKASHHLNKTFVLNDKMTAGSKFAYEWWDKSRALKAGLLELDAQGKAGAMCAEPPQNLDLDIFRKMLEEHNINPSLFGVGKAKTLPQLAHEVHSGACRMMLDATEHKKLVRVVDVVVFKMTSGTAGGGQARLLIETEERFADGRKRETNRLPGTKKEPHENARQTAERILQEMLNMSVDSIEFDLNAIVRYEEEIESPSYPGVRTVYRKEIVEAVVAAKDPAVLAKAGLPAFTAWSATDKEGNTKTFNWMTEEMANAKKVKLKAEGAEAVSTLVRAPIGLNEEQLTEQLVAGGIDVSRYGQSGKTKTLKELSAELIRGEAALVKGATGQLLRVVDVVLMIVRNPTTEEVLVQTAHVKQDGHQTTLNRLPGAKCRLDENHFLSARRILKRQLEIDENDVKILQNVQIVEEEKPTDFYPGLKTVYRKRLIEAELMLAKPAASP